MPIAAIPRYLGTNFKSASPALRFGMYLPIWTERADQENEVKERARKGSREGKELKKILDGLGMDAAIRSLVRNERLPDLWDKNDSGSRASWNKVIDLTNDHACMKALADREAVLFQTAAGSNGLELIAKSVAPFTTGLGNEHPLENGFAFLNPYGLPYLPGSGVKGVVRRAAEELAHRDFFENESGWTLPAIWHLFGFEPWLMPQGRESDAEWQEWIGGFSVAKTEIEEYLNAVLDEHSDAHKELKDRILDTDNPDANPLRALLREKHLHVRGALEFWDVVPQIKGNKLAVEIMTPHQSHYYQNKAHAGNKSPHDSGSPNPISFLTVPPDSDFVFHVRYDHRRLSRCAPELAKDGRWRALLKAAFEHAFEWLGFGAKTAVGYGAMKPDPRVEEAARRRAEEEAAIRARQEEERQRIQAENAAAEQWRAEQAAYDALPQSRKRLIEAERALKVFRESSRFDQAPLNEAKNQGNRLAVEAPGWADAGEREEAAKFLENLYEVIGWHDPGRTKTQKEKQIKKRRGAIARIRGED